ncbi:MAG: SMC-Scp complex subunit ScpB [Candidatus Palauibacterales bacterium]|nr:SMC-Scp complex subunit ScpB [Candidatus Palauibacterales bacterium]MDP2528377.1 SMC-Scp complex subunit ScpB [Candidatus Palauibacterales bacterium]MDP2583767.1 SMC-Scp complex subunit ScpB [Candidatus Palauibacterales bacterium]
MSPEQIVEATLFASQTPLTPDELARADEALTPDRVREALEALREAYDASNRAFQVFRLGDGFQILTRPEYAPYLERFDSVPRSPVLSEAALETLAIIAYRQPIGRVEIEEVRGVGSSSVLRTLQEWELVEVVGRGEGLGRPLLYGTTQRFLDHFGFQGLDDLPEPEALSVTLGGGEEGTAGDQPGLFAAAAQAAQANPTDEEGPEEEPAATGGPPP